MKEMNQEKLLKDISDTIKNSKCSWSEVISALEILKIDITLNTKIVVIDGVALKDVSEKNKMEDE
jgi:hypothetical protein